MKQGRFNEEQTAGSLKEHEAGRKIMELARDTSFSLFPLDNWFERE